MNSDWRYEPDKMALRESALSTLLKQYGTQLKEDGSPLHPTKDIFECAHDWVSQGKRDTVGLLDHYELYYSQVDDE